MAEAKIVIKAENNIRTGVSSATSDLNRFARDVENISKKISSAFNFSAVAIAIKGITSLTNTATNAIKTLSNTTVKLTKDIAKYSTEWALGYEEMRLTYERLKLSIGDGREFENIVNTIDTLARVTTISKNEIEALASELAMLGKSATEIDKISKASVYLSTVTGKDLNSSMTTLLNTYNGVTTQLDKLGLNMKKFSKEELANGAAIDEVIKKYQDLNDEIASTSLLQAIQNIKEAGNTLKDGVGAFVADAIGPTLQKISEAIIDIEDAFSNIDGRVDFKGLIGLAKAFADELFGQIRMTLDNPATLQKIVNFVSKVIQVITPIITAGIAMIWNSVQSIINSNRISSYEKELANAKEREPSVKKRMDAYSNRGEFIPGYLVSEYQELSEALETLPNKIAEEKAKLVKNVEEAVTPVMGYMGEVLPKALNECVVAAKDLSNILPGMWDNSFKAAENYLNNYRASQVKLGGNKGGTWYGEALLRNSQIQQNWDKLAITFNKVVTPRITEPIFGFAEVQESMGSLWNRFINEEDNNNRNLFKLTYSQYLEQIKQNEALYTLTEEVGKSYAEVGQSNITWYDNLKRELFGYTQQVLTPNGAGGFTSKEEFVSGALNGTGQQEADFLSETLDSLIGSLGIFGDMILGMNPLFAVLKPVVEGFIEIMGPMIETVIAPLQNALTKIGNLLAAIFAPVFEKIAPVFTAIADILMRVIQPVLMIMQAPLTLIATVLTILEPILELVTKAFDFLLIPIRAVAATLQWLAAWIKFIFLSLYNAIAWIWGGTKDNSVPSSWSEYYAQSGQSASYESLGLSNGELLNQVLDSVSTSTAVQNASYTGAGNLTMNIYIQAPLVGSDGMEEFARMLKQEMADLGYYGVAS